MRYGFHVDIVVVLHSWLNWVDIFCGIMTRPHWLPLVARAAVVCVWRSLQETYEKKKQEHVADMQKKEEDMRQMFVVRVKEKEAELKEAEKEVRNGRSARMNGVGTTELYIFY